MTHIALGAVLLATGLALLAGAWRPAWSALAAAAAAAASSAALALAWASGGGPVLDLPWLSRLGARLTLGLDPLGAPLAVFATGIAAPIFVYTHRYLPVHLAHEARPPGDLARFCRLMLAFMLAMVLLLLAGDLLLLFVALELTALTSFLLIEFDRHRHEARQAALLALVVTAGSSLLFLVGALMLGAELGTTVLAEVRARLPQASVPTAAAACLAAGVLAKSAQVPLHFWLPRAMVAPTPVSAYLHSAAMVAAGVFVLQRIWPLLDAAEGVLAGLRVIGFASIAAGSLLALLSDRLKRVLAGSTIAQYGYCVVLIALAGDEGLGGAPFFIVAHGLCKCALFLTAGAVTITTGADRLSATGGLGRRWPLLAAASALAAAGLAGLPGTIGYFKDELLFAASVHQGPTLALLAAVAAALTLAYTLRFWLGIFAGPARESAQVAPAAPAPALTLPVALLAGLAVLGGLWTAPLQRAFAAAGSTIAGHPVHLELAYHLEPRPELWMTLAAWSAGLLLAWAQRPIESPLRRGARRLARRIDPARLAARVGVATRAASNALHRIELRDLRDRISAVLVPTAVFVALGLLGHRRFATHPGELGWADLPVVAALLVSAIAAVATVRSRQHVTLVLMLSFVGFSLALAYALTGAPDVALVSVLVETTLTLLFVALLARIRPQVLSRAQHNDGRRRAAPWPGLIAGATAFSISWFALAAEREDTVAWEHIRLAESAHAKDVVTAILADFRGLDTAGELTVLAVAIIGAAGIAWAREHD